MNNTSEHLSKLESSHKEDILQRCHMGFWRILTPVASMSECRLRENTHEEGAHHAPAHLSYSEISPRRLPAMYLDDTMLKLLGLDEHLAPHECYAYWDSRIVCKESDAQNSGDHDHQHLDVIRYTWNHPREGYIRFRCRIHNELSADGRTLITEAAVDRLSSKDVATAILSSDMVKTIIEHIPVGADVWNKNLQLVESNPACYEKFFDAKEEYFERFFELSPQFQPDGMPSELKAKFLLRQTFERGFHSEPWLHCNIQGDIIPTMLSFVKLSENYVLVFCNDRREEFKIHSQLAEAKEKQEILYDNIPLGLFLWSNGAMTDCNTHLLNLLGVVDKDLFLKNPANFLPHVQANGQFSPQVLETHQTKAVQEGYCKFPFTFITIDGDRIPTEMTIYSVMRDDTPVNYCFTKDLRIEIALNEEIERNVHYMQVVLDACPMAVSLWTSLDNPLYLNKHFYALFGIDSKEEFRKTGDFFAFSPEYQPCGKSSYDLAHTYTNTALEEGECTFKWLHSDLHAKPIPTEITLVRTQIKNEEILLAYIKDLRPENPHTAHEKNTHNTIANTSLLNEVEGLKEHGYK